MSEQNPNYETALMMKIYRLFDESDGINPLEQDILDTFKSVIDKEGEVTKVELLEALIKTVETSDEKNATSQKKLFDTLQGNIDLLSDAVEKQKIDPAYRLDQATKDKIKNSTLGSSEKLLELLKTKRYAEEVQEQTPQLAGIIASSTLSMGDIGKMMETLSKTVESQSPSMPAREMPLPSMPNAHEKLDDAMRKLNLDDSIKLDSGQSEVLPPVCPDCSPESGKARVKM